MKAATQTVAKSAARPSNARGAAAVSHHEHNVSTITNAGCLTHDFGQVSVSGSEPISSGAPKHPEVALIAETPDAPMMQETNQEPPLDSQQSGGAPAEESQARILARTRLSITGPTELWYFDGAMPASYMVSKMLISNAAGGAFLWTSSPHLTLTAANEPGPTVTTAAASAVRDDAVITLQHTAYGVFTRFASLRLTIKAPSSMTPLGSVSSAIPRGWHTQVWYSIEDQFGTTLPESVPVNEQWDVNPPIPDFVGTNWPSIQGFKPSGQRSENAAPTGWDDNLSIGDSEPPVLSPPPMPPGSGGRWSCTSENIGKSAHTLSASAGACAT